MLVCLCPYGFDNPRNTLRSKLLQLASVRLQIILFGLRSANSSSGALSFALLLCKKYGRPKHLGHMLLAQSWVQPFAIVPSVLIIVQIDMYT
jgi:hypothetical protein